MKKNKPLVSIITVVYNGEVDLEKTILSVVNQKYENIEYILIDGGSKDGTLDIIEKYKNKISYFISEKDNGIYDAMNKGIMAASGDWINFMNVGDTFYNDQVIQEVFQHKNQSNYIIYGKANVINNEYNTNFSSGKEVLLNDCYFDMPICHQSIFHPKKAFLDIGLFDISFNIVADHAWFLKAMNFGYQFEFVDLNISNYLMDGYSTQNQTLLIKEKYRLSKIYFADKYIKNRILFWKLLIKIYISQKLNNTNIYKYIRKKKYENKK